MKKNITLIGSCTENSVLSTKVDEILYECSEFEYKYIQITKLLHSDRANNNKINNNMLGEIIITSKHKMVDKEVDRKFDNIKFNNEIRTNNDNQNYLLIEVSSNHKNSVYEELINFVLDKNKTESLNNKIILITDHENVDKSKKLKEKYSLSLLVRPFLAEHLLQYLGMKNNDEQSDFHKGIVAKSVQMQKVLKIAKRAANSKITVMLLGESGVGKEILSRMIHEYSPNCKGDFVAVNCAAIPENMLEAILFGHEKGAFTGAATKSIGKFELANNGTLLLDEISEMPLGLQSKILRVIQEKEVERIGGKKPISLNVRIIATTNRDLRREVALGNFRQDLYFRLNVFPIVIPPLRVRKDDIIPLAKKFINIYSNIDLNKNFKLNQSACEYLLSSPWFGNVRELENVIQRALILCDSNVISDKELKLLGDVKPIDDLSDLEQDDFIRQNRDDDNQEQIKKQNQNQAQIQMQKIEHKNVNTFSSFKEKINLLNFQEQVKANNTLKSQEYNHILQVLNQEKGSRKTTAEKLAISPRTLRYKLAKMRKMGLKVPYGHNNTKNIKKVHKDNVKIAKDKEQVINKDVFNYTVIVRDYNKSNENEKINKIENFDKK